MDIKEGRIYENVLEYICLELSQVLKNISIEHQEYIEEIRLRSGNPINIYLKGKDYFVTQDGSLTKNIEKGLLVNRQHINNTFQLISNYSVYAFEEEIKTDLSL